MHAQVTPEGKELRSRRRDGIIRFIYGQILSKLVDHFNFVVSPDKVSYGTQSGQRFFGTHPYHIHTSFTIGT